MKAVYKIKIFKFLWHQFLLHFVYWPVTFSFTFDFWLHKLLSVLKMDNKEIYSNFVKYLLLKYLAWTIAENTNGTNKKPYQYHRQKTPIIWVLSYIEKTLRKLPEI